MRNLGPGDPVTWGPPRSYRDPRVSEIEPPYSKVSTQIDVLAGRRACDELGRDFDDLLATFDYEPFDPCDQSRAEVAALIARFPDLAPTAHKHMIDMLEQAQ